MNQAPGRAGEGHLGRIRDALFTGRAFRIRQQTGRRQRNRNADSEALVRISPSRNDQYLFLALANADDRLPRLWGLWHGKPASPVSVPNPEGSFFIGSWT